MKYRIVLFAMVIVYLLSICGTLSLVNVWAQAPQQVQIAFGSFRDGNSEIYVIDTDGKNPRRLTNNPADDRYPAWSSDGKMIAFNSDRDGNDEIYVMDADGKNQRNLTNNPADGYGPSWFGPAVARSVSPAGKLGITWGKIKQIR